MSRHTEIQTHQQKQASPSIFTGLLQRKCACGQHTIGGGRCAQCGSKKLRLQRSAINETEPASVPPIVHEVLRSPGQPLGGHTRSFMEQRLGWDLSSVRVHDNRTSHRSSEILGARAWTIGSHIAFGMGEFESGTSSGRNLLAHELAHVVQQTREGPTTASRNTAETEAGTAAREVAVGRPFAIQSSMSSTVPQLQAKSEEGKVEVIPDKAAGKLRVVLLGKNGEIIKGLAEITPAPGAPLDPGYVYARTNPSDPSKLQVKTPKGYKGTVNDKQNVEVKEQTDKDDEQAEISRQIQSEMLQYFQWLDVQNGTDFAKQHAVNLRSMGYKSLLEVNEKYVNTPEFDRFLKWRARQQYYAEINRRLRASGDLEAGFTVADINELLDPTPERPPVRPEVTGLSGSRYTLGEDETSLRFSTKLRNEYGETYAYQQRWHVYIKGKGLHMRDVILDLDGYVIKKTDTKIPASHETAIDFAIGIVPVAGDAVEIAELIYIAATGMDKWGNPISDAEFFTRVGAVAVPGAVVVAIGKKVAAKQTAEQMGRAIADEAEFLANQSAKARVIPTPRGRVAPPSSMPVGVKSRPKSGVVSGKKLTGGVGEGMGIEPIQSKVVGAGPTTPPSPPPRPRQRATASSEPILGKRASAGPTPGKGVKRPKSAGAAAANKPISLLSRRRSARKARTKEAARGRGRGRRTRLQPRRDQPFKSSETPEPKQTTPSVSRTGDTPDLDVELSKVEKAGSLTRERKDEILKEVKSVKKAVLDEQADVRKLRDEVRAKLDATRRSISRAESEGNLSSLKSLQQKKTDLVAQETRLTNHIEELGQLWEKAHHWARTADDKYIESVSAKARNHPNWKVAKNRTNGQDELFGGDPTKLSPPEELQLEHIVPRSRIRNFPGFEKLSESQQIELFAMKENLIGVRKSANIDRGTQRYSQWEGWKKFVNSSSRDPKEIAEIIRDLAMKEAKLEETIQKKIAEWLK